MSKLSDNKIKDIDMFLKSHAEHYTQRQIAGFFKVSPYTVNQRLKYLGLKSKCTGNSVPPLTTPQVAPDASYIERLENLRDILKERMHQAKGGALVSIGSEYRATLRQIEQYYASH